MMTDECLCLGKNERQGIYIISFLEWNITLIGDDPVWSNQITRKKWNIVEEHFWQFINFLGFKTYNYHVFLPQVNVLCWSWTTRWLVEMREVRWPNRELHHSEPPQLLPVPLSLPPSRLSQCTAARSCWLQRSDSRLNMGRAVQEYRTTGLQRNNKQRWSSPALQYRVPAIMRHKFVLK